MLKVILKDGKIVYSEKSFNEVYTDLFYKGQTDLGNGFAIASDGYIYIEQLPVITEKEINKEL